MSLSDTGVYSFGVGKCESQLGHVGSVGSFHGGDNHNFGGNNLAAQRVEGHEATFRESGGRTVEAGRTNPSSVAILNGSFGGCFEAFSGNELGVPGSFGVRVVERAKRRIGPVKRLTLSRSERAYRSFQVDRATEDLMGRLDEVDRLVDIIAGQVSNFSEGDE